MFVVVVVVVSEDDLVVVDVRGEEEDSVGEEVEVAVTDSVV